MTAIQLSKFIMFSNTSRPLLVVVVVITIIIINVNADVADAAVTDMTLSNRWQSFIK